MSIFVSQRSKKGFRRRFSFNLDHVTSIGQKRNIDFKVFLFEDLFCFTFVLSDNIIFADVELNFIKVFILQYLTLCESKEEFKHK